MMILTTLSIFLPTWITGMALLYLAQQMRKQQETAVVTATIPVRK